MAGFLLRVAFAAHARHLRRRRASRLRTILELLRTAEEHLAHVASPLSLQEQAIARVDLEKKLGMGVGTCDQYEVITMAQLNALLDELRVFLPSQAYHEMEAAELRRRISEDLIPPTLEALACFTIPMPFC